MSMYKAFESALSSPFDLSAMLERINTHHIKGNLSDDERDRLESLARSKADPSGGLDIMAKLREMDERLRVLEKKDSSGGAVAAEKYVPASGTTQATG